MSEIGEVVERYRVDWAMPGLKLHHTVSRGHHLQVRAVGCDGVERG